jgi:hypothetical protein
MRVIFVLLAAAAILGLTTLATTIRTTHVRTISPIISQARHFLPLSPLDDDTIGPAPLNIEGDDMAVPLPPPPQPAPPTMRQKKECSQLNAGMVATASRANDAGIIFATFANHAQLDFALNWVAHLHALRLASSALLGATDAPTASGLARSGLPAQCFPLDSAIGADEAKWGSPGFSQMGRTKAKLLLTLLSWNATVFFADADVAFLRDPLPYVQRQLAIGAHLLFHTDGFGSSAEAIAARPEGLERPSWGFTPELNTGLFVMTPSARPLAEEWCNGLKSDAAFANWKNDQQTLNQLARRGVRLPTSVAPASRANEKDGGRADLIVAFEGRLMLGLLPSHLFPSGHVYFIQRQLRRHRAVVPFAVHLTFQNCDQSGKRHRMREARLWAVDPPEYYHPVNGLLSYTPDLPPDLTAHFNSSALPPRNLRAGDQVVARHFQLINHQLVQVRTALRLAHLLNRTLVLPRFLCGLETVTNFAHSGVRCRGSNGCATALPYWCPADHVLRMHFVAGVMPQVPQVPLRVLEHSALRHPASPAHDPAQVVLVDVKGAPPARACAHCADDDDGAYLSPSVSAASASLPSRAAAAADTVAARSIAAARAGGAQKLEVPAGAMDDASVRDTLGGGVAARARLLHVSSLRPNSGLGVQLDLTRQRDAFVETLKPLGGGWCCVEPSTRGSFGHFWYDVIFDALPHTDRFGRMWSTSNPWVPTPGP